MDMLPQCQEPRRIMDNFLEYSENNALYCDMPFFHACANTTNTNDNEIPTTNRMPRTKTTIMNELYACLLYGSLSVYQYAFGTPLPILSICKILKRWLMSKKSITITSFRSQDNFLEEILFELLLCIFDEFINQLML
jgi:hypothetical protein